MPFAIGLDYGINSGRALVFDCADGREIGTAVVDYPSGHQGILLNSSDHHLARQNPADYLFALEKATLLAIAEAKSTDPDFSTDQVIGIGMDGTGSSPLPVASANSPLAFDPKFSENANAHCWLWKDHTSIPEAAAITKIAAEIRPQYLAKIGGTYSSEWFWAKIWHCLKVDPAVFDAAYSWVELADFVPAVLAGVTDPREIRRGVCMAGHKALYAADWGGASRRGISIRSGARRDRGKEPAAYANLRGRHRQRNAPFPIVTILRSWLCYCSLGCCRCPPGFRHCAGGDDRDERNHLSPRI